MNDNDQVPDTHKLHGRSEQQERATPTETQIRQWLGWLARQMDARNKTEFLIEELQSTWLESPWHVWQCRFLYRLIEAVIWGIFLGLILWAPSLGESLADLILNEILVKITLVVLAMVSLAIVFGIVYGLILIMFGETVLSRFSTQPNPIEPIEAISPSAEETLIKNTLILGIAFGLTGAFLGVVILGLTFGWTIGLKVGLIAGTTFGLTAELITLWYNNRENKEGSLTKDQEQSGSEPNQLIFDSWNNTKILARSILPAILVYCFGIKIILAKTLIVLGITGDLIRVMLGYLLLITVRQTIDPVLRIWAQHVSVRVILYRHSCSPWNYAQFLHHATDLGLLERVGRGYRFTDRSVQDQFADYKL